MVGVYEINHHVSSFTGTFKEMTEYLEVVKGKGTPGFEPGTSRSAVECSTTELYPLSFMYSCIILVIDNQ